jgi:Uma2 family endonuclease
MSTTVKYQYGQSDVAFLHNGDCLSQKEFHRIYSQMPTEFRAELIGGTVFVKEPAGLQHGQTDLRLGTILDVYQARTTGICASHNVTVILGPKDEVQPDAVLRIMPEYGGQSKNTQNSEKTFILGAPEMVAEVAHSTRSIDLHLKRRRYFNAGVLEYLVVCLEPAKVFLFDMRTNQEIGSDANGALRSKVFPGLWIHEQGLLQLNFDMVMDALNEGIKSAEHAEFVNALTKSHGS